MINSPIAWSLFAEIEAICFIFSDELPTVSAFLFNSLTTNSTALSTPLFKSIGFAPAATFLRPSLTIACASMVAVVVPSPAKSLVLDATSFTI